MSRFRWLGLIVSMCGLVLMGSAPAGASPTGGIGGRPARPDPDNPRTESIFIHTMKQGVIADDAALVVNDSDSERTVELYAVDGVVTNTGAFTCRQKAEPVVGSGGWIKLSVNELTLAPNSKVEVPFTITTPDNADVGEHNACLVFADKNEEAQASGNLRIHTRQAVRAVTTIPGDLHREIKMTNFVANAKKRQLQFTVSLKNKGNVSADVDTKIQLISLFGGVKYVNGGTYPVLANEKLDLNYTENDTNKAPFWGGWYKAVTDVRYNTDAKSLGFDPALDQVEKISLSKTIFIAPSATAIGALMLVVAICLFVAVYLWRDQLQLRKRKQNWIAYEVVKGDTLESLAKEHNISWGVIARTNKLSPPYSLEVGKEIKLPNKPKKS